MANRIKTVPVRVKLYTDEYVITGQVHTKPGGYKERVSDIVNDVSARFLVLTEATFRPTREPSALAKRCESLVVRVEDIKLLIPFESTGGERADGEPGELSNW
ncbi:MAG: DUF6812 domain-containing protein [Thermoleophilia bacterium]